MKGFKCSNCGSSKYVQIKEDKYKCAYCDAEFEILSAEKSAFEKSLTAQGLKKGVRVFKASVSEEAFYKNALIQLTMGKKTPTDILEKGKLGFVKYRYVFFANFDVRYYEVSHDSAKSVDENTVSLISSQTARFVTKINKCVPLTTGCTKEQIDIFTKNFDSGEINSMSVVGFGKDEKISCPDKASVESVIEPVAEEYKSILKQSKYGMDLMYRIENVQLLAIPEYILEYEYGNSTYSLRSFAHKLNVVGTMPNSNYTSKKMKRLNTVNLVTMIISLVMSAFSILHLLFFRYYSLLTFDFVLLIVSIGMLIFNLIINTNLGKRIKVEKFKDKRESLLNYMSKNDIKTTSNDKELINSFLRGY